MHFFFLYCWLGAGFASRQMANLAKPSLTIALGEEGSISMKAVTTFKTLEIQFKLEEEFDETTADDRKVKARALEQTNKSINLFD